MPGKRPVAQRKVHALNLSASSIPAAPEPAAINLSADPIQLTRVAHWNVENCTRAKLASRGFLNAVSTFIYKQASLAHEKREDVVIFLSELMGTVRDADFNDFLRALSTRTRIEWAGRLLEAGSSAGGSRHEKIGIIHYASMNVDQYWHLVNPSATSRATEMVDADEDYNHAHASRHPVGLTFQDPRLGAVSIGGYHNLGPGGGADSQAGYWRDQLRRQDVNATIGDWNVEPTEMNLEEEEPRLSLIHI